MNFIKTPFLLSLTALALTGCSPTKLLTTDEPRQTIYALRGQVSEPSGYTGPSKIVEIAHPTLPIGFERSRIAFYMDDGRKLDYYASANWPGPLDGVLEEFTHRMLAATLPAIITVSPTQPVDADFRLQTRVIDFQPVYGSSFDAAPLLQTRIEFTLVALPSEKIVSSFTLQNETQASSPRRDVIISELEAQLQAIESEAFVKLAPHLKQKKSAQRP